MHILNREIYVHLHLSPYLTPSPPLPSSPLSSLPPSLPSLSLFPSLPLFTPFLYYRLSQLGALCVQPCVEVDQEDWPVIDSWIAAVSSSLLGLPLTTAVDYLDLSSQGGEGEGGFSRTRPFTSTMTVRQSHNGAY